MKRILAFLLFLIPSVAGAQCITSVNNATVVISQSNDLLAEGDSIFAVTKEGVCAGSGVWTDGENLALAVAGDDGLEFTPKGYENGDSLRYEVYDVSTGERTEIPFGQANYTSCSELSVPSSICGEGIYQDGTIHQIENFKGTPIPVELAFFRATQNGPSVEVSWKTFSETNVASFEVQTEGYTSDAVSAKGSGNYSVSVDDLGYGTHEFQLYEVLLDGTKNRLATTTFRLDGPNVVSIQKVYPNPTQNVLSVEIIGPPKKSADLRVYNVLGQVVLSTEVSPNMVRLDVTSLPSGKYFLKLARSEETFTVAK